MIKILHDFYEIMTRDIKEKANSYGFPYQEFLHLVYDNRGLDIFLSQISSTFINLINPYADVYTDFPDQNY